MNRPSQRGVSIVEALLGLAVVLIACLATLNYFAHALGGVGTSGNRRAALERARERLERLMAEPSGGVKPPADGQPHFISCPGALCAVMNGNPNETVPVDDWPAQPIETTVTWLDDVDTPPAPQVDEPDLLLFDVKVWFTSNAGLDDDANRVHLRTFRSP